MNNRARGSLLGLAVCDALGAPLEFKKPGEFEPITDMIEGGIWALPMGYWTDDTSMALCLAASLIENGFDADDQMNRYVAWYQGGYMSATGKCFDCGNTCRQAIQRFMLTDDPYAGSVDPETAGNGSLMRLAPIPIYYADFSFADIESRAALSSAVTHGALTAIDACRFMSVLIVKSLRGTEKSTLLDQDPDYDYCPEILSVADGSYKIKNPPDIQGSGYVVDSLEAALWAFHNSDNFRDGALKAVNLGLDADTTGAVYGQLAGAFYGVEGIPSEWLEKLYKRDMIEMMADKLVDHDIKNCP